MFSMFLFASIFFVSTAGATDNDLATDLDTIEANEELEVLVEDVNSQLEAGILAPSASVETEDGGKLTLGVGPSSIKTLNKNGGISTLAATTKSYSAYVNYDSVGFNFSHRVAGTFQVSSGKLSNLNYEVYQTGWAYQKTHNTSIQKVDSSVSKVVSRGYFNAFQYGKQYVASLTVTAYGSGTYRVTTAKIN